MERDDTKFDTKLVHAGSPRPGIQGAVTTPIFQSAMYLFAGESDYHDLGYIRLNNTPNHRVLHEKLAALEGAEAALVTSSGMAAISGALLSVLSSGDHVLVQDQVYGGTHDLLTHDFPRFGIEVDFVDGNAPATWKAKLRKSTKAFYFESVSNPLMEVADLEAGAAFAREHGLVSLVDNTFPSPVNFRPTEWGFDLSLHSATKYLNGHSDLVAGVVIGSRELVERARRLVNHLGGSLDPHACFLLERGIKTLSVRMARQQANALAVARFLEAHAYVTHVSYPGLASHPQHARAARLFDGFGAMLSFELEGGTPAARRLLERLELFLSAPSLGGVESLATQPALTSHGGMKPEERARLRIGDGLVRLSIGIEDEVDLIADLDRALGD